MKKEISQFGEVIDLSTKNAGGCFSLNISNESKEIMGIVEESTYIHSCIIFMKEDDQLFAKGWIDNEYYEQSTANLDASKKVIIGVDFRKKGNTKIYITAGDSLTTINSKTLFSLSRSLCIFWETEEHACLTTCAYDPEREEVIREVVSGSNEPLKRFLRAIVHQNRQLYTKKTSINSDSTEASLVEEVESIEEKYNFHE